MNVIRIGIRRHRLESPRGTPAMVAAAAALVLACQAAVVPPEPEPEPRSEAAAPPEAEAPAESGDPRQFSGARAWAHMEALTSIGPRVYGSDGAAQARTYIREQLDATGLEVEDVTTSLQLRMSGGPEGQIARELQHLRARLPGESPGVLMLITHYDSAELTGKDAPELIDANGSASGVALLLELARVLSLREHPYTFEFVFIDGEAGSADLPVGVGSASFVFHLREANELDRIRTAFVFDQVADADLQITRDLRSERAPRELIWREAARLGFASAFPPGADFSSPPGAHRAFLDQRFTRIVAIVDDTYGGSEAPGLYWHSEQDTLERCAPESLAAVGTVMVGGIEAHAARLSRIDRFVRSPVSALEGEVPPPSRSAPSLLQPVQPTTPDVPAPADDSGAGDPWSPPEGGEATSGTEG